MKSNLKPFMHVSLLAACLTLVACGPAQEKSIHLSTSDRTSSEKILCAGGNSETSDAYGGGDGTVQNPYLVCTVEHFRTIHGDMNKKRFFRLTADIDFAAEKDLKMFALSPFASIDGQNHTIRHILIDHHRGPKNCGIYGQLVQDINGNRDEIKNLNIEDITILGDDLQNGAGVIAGSNWGGVISNVHVTGSVKIEYPITRGPDTWATGGLVGRNHSLIENSSFHGDVIGVYSVGGIAGVNDGIIRNVISAGTVHGHIAVGGLVGTQPRSGLVESSSSQSVVIADERPGDLTGLLCSQSQHILCNLIP